jgi:hypothetical protein
MSRWRSTWSDSTNPVRREAATVRTADPYTMNQERTHKSPVEYEIGDPDAWAETPSDDSHIKQEYEGDHVKRNEIGLGEFRADTFADKPWGKGKYAAVARQAAEQKAHAAERLARALLRSGNEKLVEAQAVDLMSLPAPILASSLRRVDQASPDALPKDVKFRRALACCKLAARLLPTETSEEHVERIATAFMRADDSILKTVLKTVKVALEEKKEEEEKEEKTAGAPKDEEKDESEEHEKSESKKDEEKEHKGEKDDADHTAKEKKDESKEDESKESEEEECEDGCFTEADRAMLTEMLAKLNGEEAEEGAEGEPSADLTDLFGSPEGEAPEAAEAPEEPAMPMMASSMPSISFDEDEDTRTASNSADLKNLFADDPEVQAHREIKASEREQVLRETGFARMASSGAKKVGNVKVAKSGQGPALEDLWERPGR